MDRRLLTDEEIRDILQMSPHRKNPFMNNLDIILPAQDAKTLKAIGEWLNGECIHQEYTPLDKDIINRYECSTCMKTITKTLKEGRWPE